MEHGERFFGSHVATMHLSPEHEAALGLRCATALVGRLFVASTSLAFEPDDTESPLLRISYRDMPRPLAEWAASPPMGLGGFELEAKSVALRMEKFAPLRTVRLPQRQPANDVGAHPEQPAPHAEPLRVSLAHTSPATHRSSRRTACTA